ncbi:hypothetical protein [Halovivax gelatinilyticus]|uniref:hypothetical protein n=1 Tax=Halovivax gelatinilyticus TaxID=2961597 RepID=UPI0020CA8AE3|nr:hypothetical protein [Halovivax gelatinilyticus]
MESRRDMSKLGSADDPAAWTDPRPVNRFELTYLPTTTEAEHDRRLFEWVLEWLECEAVTAVYVDHGADGEVTVTIETIEPCTRAGTITDHERAREQLSGFGELVETRCRSIGALDE